LSEAELELIEALLGGLGIGAGRYLGQLPRVKVVGGCNCGCPSVDLALDGGIRDAAAKPVIFADGESPDGVPVGVILWARGGTLSGLEIHPWDGSDGVRLPRPESLANFRR
jgi:hypothetical protein